MRPLQADKITSDKVRVLLLITKAGGGLDSTVVTARRSGNEWVSPTAEDWSPPALSGA